MMVVFYYFFIKAKMVNGTMSVGHGFDASIGYENGYFIQVSYDSISLFAKVLIVNSKSCGCITRLLGHA